MAVVSQQQPAANPIPFANLGTPPQTRPLSFGASCQNNTASAARALSFATPKPSIRPSTSSGGNSAGRPQALSVARTPNISGPSALNTGRAFGGVSSLFGQPKPAVTFAATRAAATGTSAPANSSQSLEALHLQDSQRNRKAATLAEPLKQERPTVSDPTKQALLEELVRHTLLGEEHATIQFHLFSARSASSSHVVKPRVLCANNPLLTQSSKYFLDLLCPDTNSSDPSSVEVTGGNEIPCHARMDDYGYESDSDLDDCDDVMPVAKLKPPVATSASNTGVKTQPKERDGLSGNDSNEPVVRGTADNKALGSQTAMRPRGTGNRHVLVKDTAFQTWYTLLNYLYTGKFSFLPLSSAIPGGKRRSSTSPLDGPRCSARSMYRLASKVGLDTLRDEAFSYIRSNLSEQNILKELSCSLVSKYPRLLEMELDVLHSLIESPSVVTHFPALAKRIANKELPHGADVIVGIHTRFLKRPCLESTPAETQHKKLKRCNDGEGEA